MNNNCACKCVEPCKKQVSREYTCSCSCKTNCRSTIRVNYAQTDNVYWCYSDAAHWEFMGSVKNVGDKYYRDEYSVYGCSLMLADQLKVMVDYFTVLNTEGSGRYCLYIQICRDEDMYEYEWRSVYDDVIVINNNRELDCGKDSGGGDGTCYTKISKYDKDETTIDAFEKINKIKAFIDTLLEARKD